MRKVYSLIDVDLSIHYKILLLRWFTDNRARQQSNKKEKICLFPNLEGFCGGEIAQSPWIGGLRRSCVWHEVAQWLRSIVRATELA